MSEIEKMYENAGVKPEYRYDCNLADTIKPVEVFPLRSCSKGEIKDYCTNKQYYRYCKVYKVNKIYPPFTAEKQIELIKWLSTKELKIRTNKQPYAVYIGLLGDDNTCFFGCEGLYFEQTLAELVNFLWQDLTPEEKQQVKGILE